jgi:hypothetical protein
VTLKYTICVDNQLSSVQRQLNLYGFKCISRGEDKGAFYHPRFRRGDWEVVKKITRYAPQKKAGEGLPFYDGGSNKLPSVDGSNVEMNVPSFNNGSLSATKPVYTPTLQPPAAFHDSIAYRTQPFQFLDSSTATTPWRWDSSIGHQSYGMDFNAQHAYVYNNAPYSQNEGVYSATSSNVAVASSSVNANTSDCGMSVEETPKVPTQSNNAPFVQVNKYQVVTINPYFDLDAELNMFFENDLPHHHNTVQPLSQEQMQVSPSIAALNVKVERCEMGVNTDLSQAAGNLHHLYDSCGDLFSLMMDNQGKQEA